MCLVLAWIGSAGLVFSLQLGQALLNHYLRIQVPDLLTTLNKYNFSFCDLIISILLDWTLGLSVISTILSAHGTLFISFMHDAIDFRAPQDHVGISWCGGKAWVIRASWLFFSLLWRRFWLCWWRIPRDIISLVVCWPHLLLDGIFRLMSVGIMELTQSICIPEYLWYFQFLWPLKQWLICLRSWPISILKWRDLRCMTMMILPFLWLCLCVNGDISHGSFLLLPFLASNRVYHIGVYLVLTWDSCFWESLIQDDESCHFSYPHARKRKCSIVMH